MSDKVKIFALGGLDETGKECLVVEINGDIFVVNCGIKHPDRTMPGIDCIIPNLDYLRMNKDRVKAFFLLHGHDDEIGALAYLYADCPAPIYCSAVTASALKGFCRHANMPSGAFDFHIVPASSRFKVAGRSITFFQTSHNIPESSGIAISTDLGNVVFAGDYVIENNADRNYLSDMNQMALIAEEKNLVLLSESTYAGRAGYTAPGFKVTPHIEAPLRDAKGRVFIALLSTNGYNIDEVIKLAVKYKKVLIPYDNETANTIQNLQECGQYAIPRENWAPKSEVNRLRADQTMVIVLGYGAKLYRKIGLLASGTAEDRTISVREEDTIILCCPATNNTEIEATAAHEEAFRSGAKVVNVGRRVLLRMHASEEDLKMVISIMKPKYYVPVKGTFKNMLDNANVALNMGINLNHTNVFLLENGQSIIFDDKGYRFLNDDIPHGDIMIDGRNQGDIRKGVIEDRQAMADGIVTIAITVDKARKLIAGPDIQIKGLVSPSESEPIVRELTRAANIVLDQYLADPVYKIDEIRRYVSERALRTIRKSTGKTPLVSTIVVKA